MTDDEVLCLNKVTNKLINQENTFFVSDVYLYIPRQQLIFSTLKRLKDNLNDITQSSQSKIKMKLHLFPCLPTSNLYHLIAFCKYTYFLIKRNYYKYCKFLCKYIFFFPLHHVDYFYFKYNHLFCLLN